MKRSAFTMIELIFVIVILGILAAVAIPKLAATRDDAKIATGLQDIKSAVSDFSSFYTSQGEFNTSIPKMTNVVFDTTTVTFGTPFNYNINDKSCVSFLLESNGTLKLIDLNESSVVCQSVSTKLNSQGSFGTFVYGGSAVKF